MRKFIHYSRNCKKKGGQHYHIGRSYSSAPRKVMEKYAGSTMVVPYVGVAQQLPSGKWLNTESSITVPVASKNQINQLYKDVKAGKASPYDYGDAVISSRISKDVIEGKKLPFSGSQEDIHKSLIKERNEFLLGKGLIKPEDLSHDEGYRNEERFIVDTGNEELLDRFSKAMKPLESSPTHQPMINEVKEKIKSGELKSMDDIMEYTNKKSEEWKREHK